MLTTWWLRASGNVFWTMGVWPVPRRLSPLVMLVAVLLLNPHTDAGDVFRDCGGTMQNERGFIHSPNFPHPFPDPISCTWILRAPPGKKIHLYFTQYFLRESFYLSEFDSYTNAHTFQGRSDLGSFDFSEHVTSVVGHKSVLTIEFHVRGKKNIHLRVEEFLNDVYGFNITYEVVDVTQPLRNGTCSVHQCSFLGHCMAADDWSRYYCDCFPGYYGLECQFGPHCDPRAARNMCLNGGSCRYFYGSFVNICDCPPGFTGVQCETRTDSVPLDLGGECPQLGCSQLCEEREGGHFACGCRKGYSLGADNTSCVLIKMHRILADFTTPDTHVSSDQVTSTHYTAAARRQLDAYLFHYGLPRSKQFHIDSFKPSEKGQVLKFQFYTRTESVSRVQLLLDVLALRGKLFNLNISSDGLHVQAFPELQILGVEHYERRAEPEGGFANLLCRARGSNRTQFRWLKDGRVFNSSLTARNVWHMYIPESTGHSHLSILNINDITIYDKGEFTCEVEDFGDVQNQTVELDVMTSPRLVITPLAASVNEGQSASFRCFSPDERIGTFHYRWLKNGEYVNPGIHTETVEDLQPTGKRLFIGSALRSANYTCVISNDVSSSSITVYLFVGRDQQTCDGEKAGGVTWTSAMDGGFDVQNCPANMAGLTSRVCRCVQGQCVWSAPNLARCQTPTFIAAFDKMEELRQGYQGESLAAILSHLLHVLQNNNESMIAGDVTLAARTVLNGVQDAVDIPAIVTDSPDRLQPELILNLLDILLNLALGATPEEKEEQHLLCRSLLTMEMMTELMGWAIPLPRNGSYTGRVLGVTLRDVEPDQPGYNNTEDTDDEQNSTAVDSLTPSLQDVLQNSVENEEPYRLLEFIHMDSLQLIPPPPPNGSNRAEWVPLSRLRSFLPVGDYWERDKFRLNLTFHHPHRVPLFDLNETVCFNIVNNRRTLEQQWTSGGCHVLESTINVTRCRCSVPAHVALFIRPHSHLGQDKERGRPGAAVLLMGSVIALCGTTAILLTYSLACRNSWSVFHCVRFNFILSLFLVNVLCIVCLQGRHVQVLCLTGRLLLHLFLLGAFSFLFVDVIHVYVLVHAHSARVLGESCWKFLVIGWGIPVLSVGSTACTSSYYGHTDHCYRWCWVAAGRWQFYPFLVPMLVLVLACILISIRSMLTVYWWTDEWRFKSRKKHMFRTGKNGSLLVALLAVTGTGCSTETDGSFSIQIVFIIFLFIMIGAVFIAYCASETRVVQALSAFVRRRSRRRVIRQNFSANSFRAFIMPEKIEERAETEEQNIHQYCTQIDNSKYTTAKKRQLRFLLGTSSSSDSDDCCKRVFLGGRLQERAREEGHIDTAVDSGIFVATDSEKSSSCGRHGSVSNRTDSCSDISEDDEELLPGEV